MILSIIVGCIIWFGFVGPYCVSSTSNELVIGYIFLTTILISLGGKRLWKILKKHL